MNKIYLGKVQEDFNSDAHVSGELIYISKHSWDCDWYWGFGYIGNKHLHTNISSLIKGESDINKIFSSTKLTQNDWWIIRDLFKQAYALKPAAEIYRYGGHQKTVEGLTDIIKNSDMAAKINADLQIVLDTLWDYLLAHAGPKK